MQNSRLASRYAQSLLDLAVEQNSLESTLKDMQLLDSICRKSREFMNMLESPIIHGDKKRSIIKAVVGENITPLSQAFIQLLVNKGREGYLDGIAAAFIRLYKNLKKIKTVKLTTAAPVNDTVKNAILKKLLGANSEYTVDLKVDVNPDLIGGFVLQMEDKLYDASVRRDLNEIKAQFTQNLHVSRLN